MADFGARFGTFVIAAALLFAALRVHKSSSKHSKVTKPAGVILSFLAGCAFLVTFVGSWMGSLASAAGAFVVAGLIICAAVLVVDWALDGRPDKPAFWAAFALAAFIVFGGSQIPTATTQVGDGVEQVADQINTEGR